jgi:hypothetical protein
VTNVPLKRTSFIYRLLSKSSWANIIHPSQSHSIVATDTDNCSSLYHLSNRISYVVREVGSVSKCRVVIQEQTCSCIYGCKEANDSVFFSHELDYYLELVSAFVEALQSVPLLRPPLRYRYRRTLSHCSRMYSRDILQFRCNPRRTCCPLCERLQISEKANLTWKASRESVGVYQHFFQVSCQTNFRLDFTRQISS